MPSDRTMVILALIALMHIKSLPGAYTLKSLSYFVKNRNLTEPSQGLLEPYRYNSRVWFDDMDLNVHLNNSSYNKMMDYARLDLCTRIFPGWQTRHKFDMLLAQTVLFFKAEIPPFSKYTVTTRVFAWDDKWIWMQSRFSIKRKTPRKEREAIKQANQASMTNAIGEPIKDEDVVVEEEEDEDDIDPIEAKANRHSAAAITHESFLSGSPEMPDKLCAIAYARMVAKHPKGKTIGPEALFAKMGHKEAYPGQWEEYRTFGLSLIEGMMKIGDPTLDARGPSAVSSRRLVNTFDNISRECRHISDLSDGIVLFEVAANIDPKWFKLIRSADMGDNWVHKYNNLKKLYKLITRYLEERLGQSLVNLDPPNLNAIAKDGDEFEVLKLCELVIAIAVQCERNNTYIQKIQSLPQESQHALMLSLEQTIGTLSGGPAEVEEVDMNQEIEQLKQERNELERGNQSLVAEFAVMNRKYDEILTENEELKQRIRDLEKASAHATQSGRSDFMMRTEIDHLRQDLQKSEERRQEQENVISTQLRAIADFSRAEVELMAKAEEAVRLKDKLDEYKHAIDKLQKTENVIEKYKKKLEEGVDLRRQIKVIEEQNQDLLERNKEIEEEYRKVLAFKTLMESYKEQKIALETKASTLAKEKNQFEYELRQQQEQFQQMEADRRRDAEQIQLLEDKVRDLEFTGGQSMALSNDLQDMETDDMENSFMGQQTSYTTDLKLKISRLERELQTLKEEKFESGGSKAAVLQHMLDDSNRLKSKYEQDYLDEHQANLVLQSELNRIRGGNGDETEMVFNLRTSLNSRERELSETKKALAEAQTNFQQTKKELVDAHSDIQMVSGDGSKALEEWKLNNSQELTRLQEEHQQLQERTISLEQENKHYLSQLNHVLTEKDGLSKIGLEHRDMMLQQERAQSGVALASHTREQLETKNQHLQQQVEQLTSQLSQYTVKLQRAKEFIVQQDSIIKESKTSSGSEGYSEAVGSLQTELATKEEEVESLKRQMREMQIQVRREQALMTSAWHDQLKKGLRENVLTQHQRLAPTSWLGVQRRVFSSQLGVRNYN
ncbi:hypothetical protein BG004_002901 [Podila humilis]|nr:hypothetical protein BG004_002901 [Podila humilis]